MLPPPHSTPSAIAAPRYVLDRIAVTPAAYEVSSVHF
jgi:hypothetical protein